MKSEVGMFRLRNAAFDKLRRVKVGRRTEDRVQNVEGGGQRAEDGGRGQGAEGRGGKIEIGSGKAAFDKLRRVKVGRRTEAR